MPKFNLHPHLKLVQDDTIELDLKRTVVPDEKKASHIPGSPVKGHTAQISNLIRLSNGDIASCNFDGTLLRWDLRKEKCLATWKEDNEIFTHLALLSDGNVITIGERYDVHHPTSIKIWNSSNKKCFLQWSMEILIKEIVVLADDTLVILPYNDLLTRGKKDTIQHWDTKTGKLISIWEEAHANTITLLSDGSILSGDGENAGFLGVRGTIKRWDPKSGKCLGTWFINPDLKKHPEISCQKINRFTVLNNRNVLSCSSVELYEKDFFQVIKLWNPNPEFLDTESCLSTWILKNSEIIFLEVLPDDSILCAISHRKRGVSRDDETISIQRRDPKTGATLSLSDELKYPLCALLALLPHGNFETTYSYEINDPGEFLKFNSKKHRLLPWKQSLERELSPAAFFSSLATREEVQALKTELFEIKHIISGINWHIVKEIEASQDVFEIMIKKTKNKEIKAAEHKHVLANAFLKAYYCKFVMLFQGIVQSCICINSKYIEKNPGAIIHILKVFSDFSILGKLLGDFSVFGEALGDYSILGYAAKFISYLFKIIKFPNETKAIQNMVDFFSEETCRDSFLQELARKLAINQTSFLKKLYNQTPSGIFSDKGHDRITTKAIRDVEKLVTQIMKGELTRPANLEKMMSLVLGRANLKTTRRTPRASVTLFSSPATASSSIEKKFEKLSDTFLILKQVQDIQFTKQAIEIRELKTQLAKTEEELRKQTLKIEDLSKNKMIEAGGHQSVLRLFPSASSTDTILELKKEVVLLQDGMRKVVDILETQGIYQTDKSVDFKTERSDAMIAKLTR